MLVAELFSKALPAPETVRETLARHILADGYHLVLDMVESEGLYLKDAVSGRRFVDLFTFYASNPLGMNHPMLRDADPFKARLLSAGLRSPRDRPPPRHRHRRQRKPQEGMLLQLDGS